MGIASSHAGDSRRATRLIVWAILGALVTAAGCTPEAAASLRRNLPAAVPQADISVSPALYCPGEILHVEWASGPQFADCELEHVVGVDPYTGLPLNTVRGSGNCKFASLESSTVPPASFDWSATNLVGSADVVGPDWEYGASYQLDVLWSGWNWNGRGWGWGYRDLTGGNRSGPVVYAYARAYPYGSSALPEGAYNRNVVTVEQNMVCNQDSGQWEYQSGTQMRYTRYICTPDGSCTSEVWYMLPHDFSGVFSACSGIREICGGEEGPVTFTAPNQGWTSILSDRSHCTTQFSGFNPASLGDGDPPIEVEGGDGQIMQGQPCDSNGLPLRRVLYSVELTPCSTPDQLFGDAGLRCAEAITTTTTEAIQSGDGQPGGDDGPIPICNLDATCGNGVCDPYCENSDLCAADCPCVDDGVCAQGESTACRDCGDPGGACGVACPTGQCGGGLTCLNGICWDAGLCGGDDQPAPEGDDGENCKKVCTKTGPNNNCIEYKTVCN